MDIEAARNEGTGADQGKVSVTITVPNGLSHGKVSLGSTTGIAITAGANNSDTVTIKGSLADVNAALNGFSFTPGVDTNTSETVTVTINDLGNNGTGTTTPLTATQTITISTIVPSNNAPAVTCPATVTSTEDTPFTFTGANTISIADVDVRSWRHCRTDIESFVCRHLQVQPSKRFIYQCRRNHALHFD